MAEIDANLGQYSFDVWLVKIVALFHFAQIAQLFLAMLDVKSNKKSFQ